MKFSVFELINTRSRPYWDIQFYDISPSNLPITNKEIPIPATLPSPLSELQTLDDALSNPQEKIIHFYASFTPLQFQAETLNLGHRRQISLGSMLGAAKFGKGI